MHAKIAKFFVVAEDRGKTFELYARPTTRRAVLAALVVASSSTAQQSDIQPDAYSVL